MTDKKVALADPDDDDLEQGRDSLSELNRTLASAVGTQRKMLEGLSTPSLANLNRQLAALSSATMGEQFKAAIANAGFVGQTTPWQKALGAMTSQISDGLLRSASLNLASQIQQLSTRSLIGQKQEWLTATSSLRALSTAGLSRSLAALAMPTFQSQIAEMFKNIQGDWGETYRRWKEQAERDIRFAEAMIALGWPPPPDLPTPVVDKILALTDELGCEAARSQVEGLISSYYTADRLAEKVAGWKGKQLLQRRMRILEKAVRAHVDGDYELSVPALVSQVEGIIADGYGHVGRMGGARYQKYIETHLQVDDPDDVDAATAAAIKAFVAGQLLAEFEHGRPRASGLSRHAILHGGDTEYPTVENSLKTILLIDVLQDSFTLVTLDRREVFHREGCPAVLKSNRRAVHHRDSQALEAQGKRPCKRCKPE
ncbi:MAG: hypothetical protein U1E22_07170 [Coriobacteriia bacterium]|nr:hypothetical protein [Coriobacteriia bacterium]